MRSSGPFLLPGRVPGGLVLLGAGALGLLLIHDLASSPWAALACLMLSFVGLVVAGRGSGRLSAASILLVAAFLRLFLVPLPPSLSNDVWRYLWDGRVALARENPYRLEPEDPELLELRDEVYERLDHREIPTIYPPLAITLFSICAGLPASVWIWKLWVVTADLLGCWFLLRLARRKGLPLSRTIWYAWNPMVALETAGMAHVDAVGVAATVAAVLLLVRP
ncbi:MAG: hypothetical protein R3234_07280, partial [Thermoanaerobaculia bacterium]|nr:hypothetical protein [Thermoanaerobaculia bacterium]